MYTVRVESDFAAAHFLSSYHGKCEQLHGHNYRVRLWAKGPGQDGFRQDNLRPDGMLVDFTILKDALRGVCKTLDHVNLNDNPVFDGNPSAERIAKYIYDEVRKTLPPEDSELISAVDVFETPTSMARYEIP